MAEKKKKTLKHGRAEPPGPAFEAQDPAIRMAIDNLVASMTGAPAVPAIPRDPRNPRGGMYPLPNAAPVAPPPMVDLADIRSQVEQLKANAPGGVLNITSDISPNQTPTQRRASINKDMNYKATVDTHRRLLDGIKSGQIKPEELLEGRYATPAMQIQHYTQQDPNAGEYQKLVRERRKMEQASRQENVHAKRLAQNQARNPGMAARMDVNRLMEMMVGQGGQGGNAPVAAAMLGMPGVANLMQEQARQQALGAEAEANRQFQQGQNAAKFASDENVARIGAGAGDNNEANVLKRADMANAIVAAMTGDPVQGAAAAAKIAGINIPSTNPLVDNLGKMLRTPDTKFSDVLNKFPVDTLLSDPAFLEAHGPTLRGLPGLDDATNLSILESATTLPWNRRKVWEERQRLRQALGLEPHPMPAWNLVPANMFGF